MAIIVWLCASPARSHPLSAEQEQRVQGGEIVIEQVNNGAGLEGLRATFQVKAPAAAIWKRLTDYDHYREIFTEVEDVTVLDQDEHGARVRFRIKAAWMNFQYTLQREYREPNHLLTWRRVDGDFKDLTGKWQIREGLDAEHSLVTCESFVDIGFLVPTTLVRNGAVSDMDRTMRRLRERVEGAAAN